MTADPQVQAGEEISAILLDQADRLFRQHATKDRLHEADGGRWPAAIWEAVQEAGLPLALVAEAQGGYGLPPADALRLIRRAAYHAVPVPLGEAMLATGLWAAASGEVVDGIATLASGGVRPVAIEKSPQGYRLDGEAGRVPWGGEADHILLQAEGEGGQGVLVLLPRPVSGLTHRRNVAYEPRPYLSLSGVLLPAAAVREAPALGRDGLLAYGALLRSEQMVGAMERCLEYALAHANERRQFGRPIGKFQAVQHMLAEAAGHFAAAAAAADGAAEAWGRADFQLAVAFAKARAGEAAGRVAAIAHQVHGAMGFTQEHPLHFATRRLWSWRDEFGGEAFWEERIGQTVCAAGGEALWDMLVRVTHGSARGRGAE